MTDSPSEAQPESLPLPAADVSKRYVRVLDERADGLVSFEFAIGWPELAVELMLPRPAFEAFCLAQHVEHLKSP